MEDLPSLYEAIASGTLSAADHMHAARRLQGLARDRSRGSVPDKRGAIQVAASLGPTHGLAILLDLAQDADDAVRHAVRDRALEMGEVGLQVLRKMLADPNEAACVTVLGYLLRAVDRSSAVGARRQLRDPRASVRAAAARLLGAVGGPGLLADLRHLEADEDDAVREAVTLAMEQIRGTLPRPPADLWWDATPPKKAESSHPPSAADKPLTLSAARRLTRAPDPATRIAAAESIGALGGLSTLADLQTLCKDPDNRVREAAEHALTQICTRVDRPDLLARFSS